MGGLKEKKLKVREDRRVHAHRGYGSLVTLLTYVYIIMHFDVDFDFAINKTSLLN